MYTNELLEQKYKAQRELSEKAKKNDKDYFETTKVEVRELFRKHNWKFTFDNRAGSMNKS